VPNAVESSLARNRRSQKRPSEPPPSGDHPEEDAVGRKMRSYLAGEAPGGAASEGRRLSVSTPTLNATRSDLHQMGYLLDSGDHYLWWFASFPGAKYLTICL
jgi:hypothetical protein